MVFGTTGTINQLLDGAIVERFQHLDQGDKVAAEYVWLGGSMSDLRSKTKTLLKKPKTVDDLPDWNYDGSSTNQAPGMHVFAQQGVRPKHTASRLERASPVAVECGTHKSSVMQVMTVRCCSSQERCIRILSVLETTSS